MTGMFKDFKTYIRIATGVSLLLMLELMACSGDDDNGDNQPPTSLTTILKNKTWELRSAKVDGTPTNEYADLTLKLLESTYESGGGYGMFGQTGTWSEAVLNKSIVFDGTLTTEVIVQDERNVTLKFNWDEPTYGTGRSKSVSGAHEFEMVAR